LQDIPQNILFSLDYFLSYLAEKEKKESVKIWYRLPKNI